MLCCCGPCWHGSLPPQRPRNIEKLATKTPKSWSHFGAEKIFDTYWQRKIPLEP